METNANRVYINPNFGKAPNRVCAPNTMTLGRHMHVNPHFSHFPNEQPNNNLNRRIFVNPNFIKSTSNISNNINVQYSEPKPDIHFNNIVLNDTFRSTTGSCINENSKPVENSIAHTVSKSKYSLVRNNKEKVSNMDNREKETCTIKISKYKSIPLHHFKTNLQINKHGKPTKQKQSINNTSITTQKYVNNDRFKLIRPNIVRTVSTTPKLNPIVTSSNINITTQKYVNKSCFKLIRHNLVPTVGTPLKINPRLYSQKVKSIHNLQLNIKALNSVRKKNNIPCRLFCKYGKCLRNLSGTCEYVHDKKHVSLCRKFIKGICHDKNCLLSHELSSKKMPTCYFYLKGMCIKDDCPYLHVKLSEKSKICHDFLRGYCDKGEKCLQRHIRPCLNKNGDGKRLDNILNKNTPSRTTTLHISKVIKTNQPRPLQVQKQIEVKQTIDCKNEEEKANGECRYYRENLSSEHEICNVLKPSRCKLGTLPSYIQL